MYKITADQKVVYLIAIIFGAFWVVIETLIAYWIYKIYKLTKARFKKAHRLKSTR